MQTDRGVDPQLVQAALPPRLRTLVSSGVFQVRKGAFARQPAAQGLVNPYLNYGDRPGDLGAASYGGPAPAGDSPRGPAGGPAISSALLALAGMDRAPASLSVDDWLQGVGESLSRARTPPADPVSRARTPPVVVVDGAGEGPARDRPSPHFPVPQGPPSVPGMAPTQRLILAKRAGDEKRRAGSTGPGLGPAPQGAAQPSPLQNPASRPSTPPLLAMSLGAWVEGGKLAGGGELGRPLLMQGSPGRDRPPPEGHHGDD
jgi:hypothetical protein